MQDHFYFAQLSLEERQNLISKDCLALLPFGAKPVKEWSSSDDLASFLIALHDHQTTATDSNGVTSRIDYSELGEGSFRSGVVRSRELARDFFTAAMSRSPAPSAEPNVDDVPDFESDTAFGRVATHAIAWSEVISAILSEDGFLSLPHTLECADEIECSVLLAKNLYYRQAKQVLRGFLENLLIQMLFCENPEAFNKWRTGDLKMPRMRGKGGLLERLVNANLLDHRMRSEVDTLYVSTSGSVHGAEADLVNRGLFSSGWVGVLYSTSAFADWADTFCRCIELGIHLQRRITFHWLGRNIENGRQCSVCHAVGEWNLVKDWLEHGVHYEPLICRECASTVLVSA